MKEKPTPVSVPCHQPAKYKMATLLYIGLLAPVYFIPPALSLMFPAQHFLVAAIAIAIIVPLMVYAIMPLLSRLFAGWLRAPDL